MTCEKHEPEIRNQYFTIGETEPVWQEMFCKRCNRFLKSQCRTF